MKDIECPYCEYEQEVNHDDGFGYEEGPLHEMECGSCGKNFVFTTSISYYYEPAKADCLNGEPHDFQPTKTYPKRFAKMGCTMCDATREMSDIEMFNHIGAEV